MGLLGEIFNNLITESVSVDYITDAIKTHKQIKVNYISTWADIADGERIIEIYAYGLTTAGNPVIRVYQPYGDTSTKVPSWKLFLISGIKEWKETGKRFYNPPEKYNKSVPEYNEDGDRSMSVVYLNAKFYGKNEVEDEKDDEIYKTSTEKGIKRLKKQLDAPTYVNKGQTPETSNEIEPSIERTIPNEPKEVKKSEENGDLNKDVVKDFNKNAKIKEPQESPEENIENEKPIFKTDTEIAMDNLKKQLENPKRIDLTKFNKK